MLGLVTSLLALAAPIPDPLPTTLPHYQGAPAQARPMAAANPPQNPYLAPDPRSNIHNDTWMTDTYRGRGPLGAAPRAFSGAMPPALCGSLTFHSRGYLVSVCPSVGRPPQARVIDPNSLEILAAYDMPAAPDPPGTKPYQNYAGGGYFFLDSKDRIWSATKSSHILVLRVSRDGRRITKVADYDLTGVLEDDERISSALPDFKGRIWFVSKKSGKVGILNPRTRRIRVRRLGEDIQNSFAVDRNAVYIVSSARMYHFRADRRGRPRIDWKRHYGNTGVVKPGQADAGSGTTPTIMHGGYVAITDNADPMNVVVYRKRTGRLKCRVPVFEKGASATENSLMASKHALFVENNHGYQDPFGPSSGALTTPGFARVDVTERGCRKAWETHTERAPSVVPKLSTRTGLIYTYTRDPAPLPLGQPYFWTAIDARTGTTAFKVYAGSGLGFNNNYAGIALGPDGTAYLGVIGGLIALH